MSAGVSDYGAGAWLASLFGVTGPITDYWLALCSDEPSSDMDGDVLGDLEPAGGGYARVRYGTGPALWAADSNFLTNLVDVDFGVPTDDWGDVSHFALCTDPTGGDLYAWGEFLNPQYVEAANQMLIPAGALVLALTTLDDSITV